MHATLQIARVAALIGDPARALMLAALMDGRSRTAGELARVAGVSPQTASAHLGKMVEAAMLSIEKQGRHRYHRLSSPEVSNAIEALMTIAMAPAVKTVLGPRERALRHARTCYDHMAGELAVDLADRWIAKGWINCDGSVWSISRAGEKGLRALGIEPPNADVRRPQVRPCLDWSERRPHMAGQLGAVVLNVLLAKGWVRRRRDSRVLVPSDEGVRILRSWMSDP